MLRLLCRVMLTLAISCRSRADPRYNMPAQVRSHAEVCIGLIAKGEMRRATVVRHLLGEMLQKYRFFVRHAPRLALLFDQSFGRGTGEQASKPRLMTRCGNSGRYLELHEGGGAASKLYNPHTGEEWPLPQGGLVKPYKQRTCPLCQFELLLFTITARGGAQRAYPLCPCCFSRQPLPGGVPPSDSPCYRCPHPEAHPIVQPLCVCTCPETAVDGGMLLLDPTGGPPWRLVSSRGAYTMQLPPFVHRLAVGERCGCTESCRWCRRHAHFICSICTAAQRTTRTQHYTSPALALRIACAIGRLGRQADASGPFSLRCMLATDLYRLLRVEFHRERSPLVAGQTVHEGCVLTDELIHSLAASAAPPSKGKGGKGNGGKAGKGGKGGKGKDEGKGKDTGVGKGDKGCGGKGKKGGKGGRRYGDETDSQEDARHAFAGEDGDARW